MIRLKAITSDDKLYKWAMALLAESFPECERRGSKLQLKVMEHPHYKLEAITDDNVPVGVVGYFDTPDFIYFENFCILPDKRNGGFGSAALRLLTENLQKPFILEAEIPQDDITRRRIEFYKRNGMAVNTFSHIQPHYRKNDEDLPLLILTYGKPITQAQYDGFRKYLDCNVDVGGSWYAQNV